MGRKLKHLNTTADGAITTRNISLSDILLDEEVSTLFCSYLQKIHALEMIEFWLGVEVYKRITDNNECIETATLLFNKYVSAGSFSEINIDSNIKEDIVNKMKEPNDVETDLYDDAQECVEGILKFTCMREFLEDVLPKELRRRSFHDSPMMQKCKNSFLLRFSNNNNPLPVSKNLKRYRELKKQEGGGKSISAGKKNWRSLLNPFSNNTADKSGSHDNNTIIIPNSNSSTSDSNSNNMIIDSNSSNSNTIINSNSSSSNIISNTNTNNTNSDNANNSNNNNITNSITITASKKGNSGRVRNNAVSFRHAANWEEEAMAWRNRTPMRLAFTLNSATEKPVAVAPHPPSPLLSSSPRQSSPLSSSPRQVIQLSSSPRQVTQLSSSPRQLSPLSSSPRQSPSPSPSTTPPTRPYLVKVRGLSKRHSTDLSPRVTNEFLRPSKPSGSSLILCSSTISSHRDKY